MSVDETCFGYEAVGPDHEPIEGRVPVRLSDADLELAVDEARRREDRRHAGSNRPIGVEGYETHLRGTISEIAVARYYGCPLDTFAGYDRGYDLVLKNGEGERSRYWRVQVKSTRNFGYGIKLACMPGEMKSSDVFILASVDTDSGYVEIVGLALTNELLRVPLSRPKGWRNANHIIPEGELRRPKPYVEPNHERIYGEDAAPFREEPIDAVFRIPDDVGVSKLVDYLCQNDAWYERIVEDTRSGSS